MTLPDDFVFSQASLQDYQDCARRFQLRYLLNLAWPAIDAEPIAEYEAHIAQADMLHRLIHQHQIGVPAQRLSEMALAADRELGAGGRLERWWQNYLAYAPAELPAQRYPEIALSAALAGFRVIAQYDLVAVEPGQKAVIVDWKTSLKRPTRQWLLGRLQTRVYRYLLARAGAHLNAGQAISPERVSMIYWFADYPLDPETLAYDSIQYQADAAFLAKLIAEIQGREDEIFPLTQDDRQCRFCVYRSLCGRGAAAGNLAEADEVSAPEAAWEADFAFEQVAEVEF